MPPEKRAALDLTDKGWSATAIAELLDRSERWVYQVRAEREYVAAMVRDSARVTRSLLEAYRDN